MTDVRFVRPMAGVWSRLLAGVGALALTAIAGGLVAAPAPTSTKGRIAADLVRAIEQSDSPTTEQRMITVVIESEKAIAPVRRAMVHSTVSRKVGRLQWVTGYARLQSLGKIASIDGVAAIRSTETARKTEAPELAELRAAAKARQAARLAAGTPAPAPAPEAAAAKPEKASFQVADILGASSVWAQGVRGTGVTVAIVDSGVDFGNPDLAGTQARIPTGPYAGWPFSYDTVSGADYTLNTTADWQDYTINRDTWQDLLGTTYYCSTTLITTPNCTAATTCRRTFNFDPTNPDSVSAQITWPKISKSGNYYYTVHPDQNLLSSAAALGLGYAASAGSPAFVLVADSEVAGVYDTVIVDINFDRNLTNDPVLKKGQEVCAGDVLKADGTLGTDGVGDLSGGMLLWISDGVNTPPGVSTVYEGDFVVPPAGRFIAFLGDEDGHGTSCAGNVAAQSVVKDPALLGTINPQFAGGSTGKAVSTGMAPGAKIAGFQSGLNLPFDAWVLAAYGFDGVAESGDEVHIISNSWGDSEIIDDGWDETSQVATEINRLDAPTVAILFATGNGGPGYSTVTSGTGPTIIDVGASTSYGTTLDFENTGAGQGVWGSVMSWSNRGPNSLAQLAPDVVGVGAWGTAPKPLNLLYAEYPTTLSSGEAGYELFGGTSMACPISAGVLALVYEAFNTTHGRYPTWAEANELLQAGSKDLGFDPFTQGAGQVNALRSVEIAKSQKLNITPTTWIPGDYRGNQHTAFPRLVSPGGEYTIPFTISNPGAAEATIQFSTTQHQQISQREIAITLPAEAASDTGTPRWVQDITAEVASLKPDLIRAELRLPMEEFDANADNTADTSFRVLLYDWQDLDGSGDFWTDTNGNQLVDADETDKSAEGSVEYIRMTYGYTTGTTLRCEIGADSISRVHDGLLLGVQRREASTTVSNITVRLTYFKRQATPWVTVAGAPLAVPPGGSVEAVAQLTIPADAKPGWIQANVLAKDGTTVVQSIPLLAAVAPNTATFSFGAADLSQAPSGDLYDNASIMGNFDWTWRYEAGDWRSYFFDVPAAQASPGTLLFVETKWKNAKTDIDTWVLNRVLGSEPTDSGMEAFYGPYLLGLAGGSQNAYVSAGIFNFQTATGGAHEYVAAPLAPGLNMISLHAGRFAGNDFQEPVVGQTFRASVAPTELTGTTQTGSFSVEFTSERGIPGGMVAKAYGLVQPVTLPTEAIAQDDPNDVCSSTYIKTYTISGSALFEVETSSTMAADIDLYVFQDDGDGTFDCSTTSADVMVASSTSAASSEYIGLLEPGDGTYFVVVHGYDVSAANSKFTLWTRDMSGNQITLATPSPNSISPGVVVTIDGDWSASATPGVYEGLIVLGPELAPGILRLPVSITVPDPNAVTSSGWIAK